MGDLYQGAITYGEAGQFFSAQPIARMMAAVTVRDVPEEARHEKKSVSDPACGSGRMLLAVAEMHSHWLFVGQDVDLRCVRMCAINLALRNLYSYVIQGNSLADERRLVYRTGFDPVGVISEVPISECPNGFSRSQSNRLHHRSTSLRRAWRMNRMSQWPTIEAKNQSATRTSFGYSERRHSMTGSRL